MINNKILLQFYNFFSIFFFIFGIYEIISIPLFAPVLLLFNYVLDVL